MSRNSEWRVCPHVDCTAELDLNEMWGTEMPRCHQCRGHLVLGMTLGTMDLAAGTMSWAKGDSNSRLTVRRREDRCDMCNGARVERNRYYPYKSMKVVWDLMPPHLREETPTASRLCDPCFERHKKRRQRWAKARKAKGGTESLLPEEKYVGFRRPIR